MRSRMLQTLDFLKKMADPYGEAIALDDVDSEISHNELTTAVNALAVALQANDPTPGSRVILCAENCPEYLVSVMAILAAGKILVPLGVRGSPQEMFDILNATYPTSVIVDDAGSEVIPCHDDMKINFNQFPGLVLTYRGQEPLRFGPEQAPADTTL
ncbi:hypothetical protein CKA81_09250 [Pollutimonas thiosulfatoxidans]|uniref:AMP-dependent synthetase/ligase domain-containing protein n=2 Tax=Pollutimonas thiosulfatoxidans TaxID=2028345 RepID=A0A410GCK0_9BURK|nr:hypothetical protein CKA81_09250 [Pollutimonas thiosulfatoxidans]